ncbi:MAG: TetR/AcrR family transcriptional regulator [Bacteroidales bacterium]|nr:TetR/AcrR family transcriptional regulator [Bacteroidales bacterium]
MWLNYLVNTYSFMTEHEKNTEDKILDAAKDVFQQKGMTGARMQEIADKAGINKALLHYYYRTKEKLFEKVFEIAFSLFIPKVKEMMSSDKPIFEKIEFFVENYLNLLQKHPYIPGFIISELNRNPKMLVSLIEKNVQLKEGNFLGILESQIKQEVDKGIVKPISAHNLMTNVISLCIFPIVARPILQGVLFDNDKKEFDVFLEQRRTFVKEYVINSIKA